ncbi:unnamed protein product [Rotaria sp. Silwood1]|nr:unnamed protein product [Rotaria sp. Silwood1]
MSTNTEQEKSTVELPSTISIENENPSLISSTTTTTDDNSTTQVPIVEEQHSTSSWFDHFGLSSNLTNQLTNISSSIMQVTSKVGAVANTLVHKTLPQRPSSPIENQQSTDITTNIEDDKQTSEESTGMAGINKDLTTDNHTVNTHLANRDYGEIRSAGHLLHEWTSHTAFPHIFKFFEDERKKLRMI